MSVRTHFSPLAAVLALSLAACGGEDTSAPSATVTVTVTATVTQTATVTEAPAVAAETSDAAAPTPTQVGPHIGMVWASEVDSDRVNQPAGSQPTFDGGDGIVVRIENLLYVDASVTGDLARTCSDELEWGGKPDDTHCLFVQWSFDVPVDYAAADAGLAPGPLLTPDGRQIELWTSSSGVPGAKNVVHVAVYSGAVPGSTIRWDVGSNERQWKTLKFEVPSVDSFLPISFD